MDESVGVRHPFYPVLKQYVRVFRPFTLITPVVGGILGVSMGLYSQNLHLNIHGIYIMVLVALTLAGSNALGNALNEYADIIPDQINKPKRAIVSGQVNRDTVVGVAFAAMMLSVGLAMYINTMFAYFILAINFMAMAYSLEPFRLKARLYVGNMSIGTPRGLLGIWGAWVASGAYIFNHEILLIGFMLALYVYFANITKDLPDIAGDMAGNIRNFATVFGLERAARLTTIGYILPFVILNTALLTHFVPMKYIWLNILLPIAFFQGVIAFTDPLRKWKGENGMLWAFFYIAFSLIIIAYAIVYFL